MIKFFIFMLLFLSTSAENLGSCRVTHDESSKSTDIYCYNIKVGNKGIPIVTDLTKKDEYLTLHFLNSYGKITEESLENLRDLNSIEIVDSNFDEFVLPTLPNLSYLKIVGSTLPTLQGALKNVKSLNILTIINNYFNLDDNSFKGLQSLLSLETSQQEINLSETIFRDLKNIYRLVLNKANIEKVPNYVFQENTDLITLNLEDNPIMDINQGALDPLRKLKSLLLLKTNLKKFDTDLVKDLKTLATISVPARAIRDLDFSQLLKNNPNLSHFFFLPKDTECLEVKSLQSKINKTDAFVSIVFDGSDEFEKSC